MSGDAERWIELEGPAPEWVREILDAGREIPTVAPEEAARAEQSFLCVLAAEQRAEQRRVARARRVKVGVVVALLAAAVGVAGTLALRARPAWLVDAPRAWLSQDR